LGAQPGAEVLAHLEQRAGDAQADRVGLAAKPAAVHRDLHVELALGLGGRARASGRMPQHVAGQVLLQRAAVHLPVPAAGAEVDAGHRRLAAADGVVLLFGSHSSDAQKVRGSGFCAWCGCSGPAYTLSLWRICRPSAFLGSMPFTASSITRSGCLASISLKGMNFSWPMYPEWRK